MSDKRFSRRAQARREMTKRTNRESTLGSTVSGVVANKSTAAKEPEASGVRPPRSVRAAPRKAIPKKVENIVWARAAGRCQYAGCNKLLVGDQISGAANASGAYVGHIVADSPGGA